MKVFIYLFLFISFSQSLFSQVNIKGEIHTEHKEISLKVLDPKTLDYVSLTTQRIKRDRSFEFLSPFNGPNLYQLQFDEQEVLYLSVENTHPIVIKRTSDSIHIEGSPSTVKMRAFRQQNEMLQAKYFGKMKRDLDEAMAVNDSARVQKIMEKADIALQEFLKEFRTLIEDLGTTPAAYYALQFSDFNKEINFIKKRLVAFQKEKPGSPITQALELQVRQTQTTEIGKFPPHFEATDLDQRPFLLNNLRGKVILIDFWASWCRACRVENPKFVKLYQKYSQSDFEIVSISQDEDFQSYMKAIKKDDIEAWTHIWDQDKTISNLYSATSLPQNIVLDKKGKIMAKNIKADQLEELLTKMLN